MTAPFNRRALQDAIEAWITRSTGATFIWEGQNGPNPAYPYLTGKLSGPTSYGQDEQRIDGDPPNPIAGAEVAIESVGQRKLMLSVNAYARATGDLNIDEAAQYLDKARAACTMQSYVDAFAAAGLGFIGDQGLQNLDFVNSDKFLSRAQMDFAFNIASNSEERVGYIATAQVIATDLGWNPETFTVPTE